MSLSSHIAYQKYGVPRSLVLHLTSRIFHFPLDYQDTLQSYFILRNSGANILATIADYSGFYRKDDVDYIPIHNTPRGKILSAPQSYYYLSFREAQPEYNIPAYVLIASNA
jgi:hypothetical protein